MSAIVFLLKVLRRFYSIWQKIYRSTKKNTIYPFLYENYVELFNQDANTYIYKLLMSGKPCMISKFGTIELNALVQYKCMHQGYYCFSDYIEYITFNRPTLWWCDGLKGLCSNAGFFPNDSTLLSKYFEINLDAIKKIDVLGSYCKDEYYFKKELFNAKKVNLDGYYAPFFFLNPWTHALKGKRILVIHPFSDDIKEQYKKRNLIWTNNVLPEFELIVYKSVQSILGIKTNYSTWFEALDKMKKDIAELDFDIAIVGCGAYGMPLAAYIKELGKQAIHMAGWTQVLFGIIGKRWENNPSVAKYINEYWIHPSKSEIPHNAGKIEGGCYW